MILCSRLPLGAPDKSGCGRRLLGKRRVQQYVERVSRDIHTPAVSYAHPPFPKQVTRAVNEAFLNLLKTTYWHLIEHNEVVTAEASPLLASITTSLGQPLGMFAGAWAEGLSRRGPLEVGDILTVPMLRMSGQPWRQQIPPTDRGTTGCSQLVGHDAAHKPSRAQDELDAPRRSYTRQLERYSGYVEHQDGGCSSVAHSTHTPPTP